MNWVNTIIILLAAYLAVFWEAAFGLIRHLLGAQVSLLPAIVIYAALSANWGTTFLAALVGGLCFDSLSANPLGISVPALLLIGLVVHENRGLILQEQIFAQVVLGGMAGLFAPGFTLLLLFGFGQSPLVGWGTAWQLLVMTIGSAVATPVCFRILARIHHALTYHPVTQTSFRPDREIKRNRGS
jgi:rod shape-determining protein MreD